MSTDKVAAIDIGHSEVKVSGPKGQFSYASFACPAVTITDVTEANRAALETVNVDGKKWFVGKTAILQSGGVLSNGLSDNWIETPEYSALLTGAIKKLKQTGVDLDDVLITLGLPARLHQRQKDRLRQLMREIIPAEILVLPQPIGPYYAQMLDENGQPHHNRPLSSMSWAVVDVGYYTTDFLLMIEGRWIEAVKDSVKGVHVAAQTLQRILREKRGIDADLPECKQAMQTKQIRHFGVKDITEEVAEAATSIIGEVVDTADRLLANYVRKLDGVIVAGGGSYLVTDALKRKWPTTIMAHQPRFAVAEGFRRFGLGYLAARQAKGAA